MSWSQPQHKVKTSSLLNTYSSKDFSLKTEQITHSEWENQKKEKEKVDWLILHFNDWFSHQNVKLVYGNAEPEYFPATKERSAEIQFAHGFFNSALHEISHWTIAGPKRRLLPDLGYWYTPDGRSNEQQKLFEQVEIKPQAIEWLFAQAFGLKFRVSVDNLTGDGGDSIEFKDNVYQQVQQYFSGEAKLPRDAAYFIRCICHATRNGKLLEAHEFKREALD